MKSKKTLFVLISASIGGTERRICYLFKELNKKDPDKYHLVVNRKLYNILQKANFQLDKLDNVHILKKKSLFDFKKGEKARLLVDMGRLCTLLKYRKNIKHLIKKYIIGVIQVYLEMIPVLGLFPIKRVKRIASIISHRPEYYDKKKRRAKLLKRALRNYHKIDALYVLIYNNLVELGINPNKINYPKSSFVNHATFKPEKKEKIITFSSRLVNWKKPLLFLHPEAIPSNNDWLVRLSCCSTETWIKLLLITLEGS